MELRTKNMHISSGGPLVAVINQKDAEEYDLHTMDRVKIIKGKKIETVVIDTASKKAVPKGKIGLYEEVCNKLKLNQNEKVKIIPAQKPLSIEFIRKKMDGERLSKEEINQIVWDIVHNKLSTAELSFFVAACYCNEMNTVETTHLTKAMACHGDILKINRYPIVDKHCVGGVAGNRTTMLVVPILAAAGVTIPKTSSRSITSPAGTADTMEVLANVCVPLDKMKQIVTKANGCIIWGGALNLAPADDKIIRVERPLSIDAKSQLLASVMAKKASVSATHVLVDIPSGKGSKSPTKKKATQLKNDFQNLAKKIGIKVDVLITDGRQPIGNGIGPALEARDVLYILKNDARGPADLRKKSLVMAGKLLEIAGKAKKGQGLQMARAILLSGQAYDKMCEIIKLQGKKTTDPDKIEIAKEKVHLKARKSGKIKTISNLIISKVARLAGAPEDHSAGIYLYNHIGDKVKKGDTILTVYTSKAKLPFVKKNLEDPIEFY